MESDVRVAVQQLADGKPHFRGRQLIGSHLVEQRLESVIVTLVDERDPDVGIAQFLERADAAEPGAKDHYMRQFRHGLRSSSVRKSSQVIVPSGFLAPLACATASVVLAIRAAVTTPITTRGKAIVISFAVLEVRAHRPTAFVSGLSSTGCPQS